MDKSPSGQNKLSFLLLPLISGCFCTTRYCTGIQVECCDQCCKRKTLNLCLWVGLPSRAALLTAKRWGFPPANWWRWSSRLRNPLAPDCGEPQTPAKTQQHHSESHPKCNAHRDTQKCTLSHVLLMMQSGAKQQARHIWFQSGLVPWFDSKDQHLKQKNMLSNNRKLVRKHFSGHRYWLYKQEAQVRLNYFDTMENHVIYWGCDEPKTFNVSKKSPNKQT